MERIELSQEQINNLARPLVGMVEVITDFFKDSQNEKDYREWYFKKYGRYPKEALAEFERSEN